LNFFALVEGLKKSVAVLGFAMAGLATPACFAAGTPAGTPITNSATLNYSISGQAGASLTAAAPVLTVAELINVVLTWQDGTPAGTNSPDAGKALAFLLTNTGNGVETFSLLRNNAIAGDQFDPVNAPAGGMYLESGLQAGFQASGPNADVAYVAGVNDPVLAADASRTIYLYSTIPAGQATGALGYASLTAASTTVGARGAVPGATLPGLGQGGIDAVVGGSRAQAVAQGAYIVSGIGLSVVKAVVAVQDPLGGALVMPGSVLTYRITLALTGVGIADNLSFSDPLPLATTFVPASITVDGSARTDALDADNASFSAGAVAVLFGNTAVPATRVIEFKATVN
jgi:uncharacterized repeat protein (TIGR01451 family)